MTAVVWSARDRLGTRLNAYSPWRSYRGEPREKGRKGETFSVIGSLQHGASQCMSSACDAWPDSARDPNGGLSVQRHCLLADPPSDGSPLSLTDMVRKPKILMVGWSVLATKRGHEIFRPRIDNITGTCVPAYRGRIWHSLQVSEVDACFWPSEEIVPDIPPLSVQATCPFVVKHHVSIFARLMVNATETMLGPDPRDGFCPCPGSSGWIIRRVHPTRFCTSHDLYCSLKIYPAFILLQMP